MGIAYRSDVCTGCTFSVWDGDITADDVEKHLFALSADVQWPPGRRQLTDLSTVGALALPDPYLLDLMYEGTELPGQLVAAVVVRPAYLRAPDPRYPELDELGINAFADIAAAAAHIGIEPSLARDMCAVLRRELERMRTEPTTPTVSTDDQPPSTTQ